MPRKQKVKEEKRERNKGEKKMQESSVMHKIRTVTAIPPLNLHCGNENREKELTETNRNVLNNKIGTQRKKIYK